MSGTKVGGLKAAETNKRKHGKYFYKEIGRKGGSVKTQKGFALMPEEKRRAAGRLGGTRSKRTKNV